MSGTGLPLTPAVHAGDWVILSGQLGVRAGRVVSPDEGEQTRAALRNIADLLSQHALSLTDIVKTTVYLTSMEHFDAMNAAYKSAMGDHAPARTCVAVLALPVADALVEIETWARPR